MECSNLLPAPLRTNNEHKEKHWKRIPRIRILDCTQHSKHCSCCWYERTYINTTTNAIHSDSWCYFCCWWQSWWWRWYRFPYSTSSYIVLCVFHIGKYSSSQLESIWLYRNHYFVLIGFHLIHTNTTHKLGPAHFLVFALSAIIPNYRNNGIVDADFFLSFFNVLSICDCLNQSHGTYCFSRLLVHERCWFRWFWFIVTVRFCDALNE